MSHRECDGCTFFMVERKLFLWIGKLLREFHWVNELIWRMNNSRRSISVAWMLIGCTKCVGNVKTVDEFSMIWFVSVTAYDIIHFCKIFCMIYYDWYRSWMDPRDEMYISFLLCQCVWIESIERLIGWQVETCGSRKLDSLL